MRVRRKPGAYEALVNMKPYFIEKPTDYKGRWHEAFGSKQPIHAEFGGGKGRFIVNMAKKYPNINFILIDAVTEIALKAAEFVSEEKMNNVKVVLADLANVQEIFDQKELDRIYLNFSDPWPKKKHYKRRLTYRGFLKLYKDVLTDEGWIEFKTDNKTLFEFSLNEFADIDMKMKNIALDLHSQTSIDNVMTEYEEKFSKMGHPIYRVEAQFK